jgi:beta-aspartyl-dipeptidase (metallo-type)
MDTVDGELLRWISMYRDAGGPPDKLSVCSDAHTAGGDVAKLFGGLVDAVGRGIPLEEMLPAFTACTADAWCLAHKGRIRPGCDADLVFVDPVTMCIKQVIARGRVYRRADPQAQSSASNPGPFLTAITMTCVEQQRQPVNPERPFE